MVQGSVSAERDSGGLAISGIVAEQLDLRSARRDVVVERPAKAFCRKSVLVAERRGNARVAADNETERAIGVRLHPKECGDSQWTTEAHARAAESRRRGEEVHKVSTRVCARRSAHV